MSPSRSIALMGATGSIGTQTLEVLRREPNEFTLVAITGGTNVEQLSSIAKEFNVRHIGVSNDESAKALRTLVGPDVAIEIGSKGLEVLSSNADIVVNAVMGFAGLPVTMSALAAGKRLALANKESLIAAAPLVEKVRSTPGAVILPIDSEHCAIHQALASSTTTSPYPDVRRIILTASGGPFRGWSQDKLSRVTKADALAHPTWTMGPKITIDSSTLMNKGLEVLEASALFGIEVDRVDVVVHPQSIVHSMVEYIDGSVMAQLSKPDMRLPIAYCLGLPGRLDHAWGQLDFSSGVELTFETPDRAAFPALDLAYAAARLGGAAPAWLSAANEICVEAFLQDMLSWQAIAGTVEQVMEKYKQTSLSTVNELLENDAEARRIASAIIAK
jgi:1-deoxy-D-xylulose-5-phosphate reductoisomerase